MDQLRILGNDDRSRQQRIHARHEIRLAKIGVPQPLDQRAPVVPRFGGCGCAAFANTVQFRDNSVVIGVVGRAALLEHVFGNIRHDFHSAIRCVLRALARQPLGDEIVQHGAGAPHFPGIPIALLSHQDLDGERDIVRRGSALGFCLALAARNGKCQRFFPPLFLAGRRFAHRMQKAHQSAISMFGRRFGKVGPNMFDRLRRETVGVQQSRVRNRFQQQAYNYVGTGNVEGTLVTPADPSLTDENTNRDERSTELYARDAIALTERLTAWLGVRHTRLQRESVRTNGSRPTDHPASFTTPSVALGYELGRSLDKRRLDDHLIEPGRMSSAEASLVRVVCIPEDRDLRPAVGNVFRVDPRDVADDEVGRISRVLRDELMRG